MLTFLVLLLVGDMLYRWFGPKVTATVFHVTHDAATEAAVRQACAACGASENAGLDDDLGHKSGEVLYHASVALGHPLNTVRSIAKALAR